MTDPSAEQQHPQWVFFGKHFKELPFIIHEHYKVINAPLALLGNDVEARFGSVLFSLKDRPKSSDRLVSDNALFRSTTK